MPTVGLKQRAVFIDLFAFHLLIVTQGDILVSLAYGFIRSLMIISQVDINESELRIDTYRASGAGGQHVNTTDSAVRITHIPTNIVVQCQNDRSQHKNRATAMNMLKARLYEAELQRREEEANTEHAGKTEIGWGHQIRSYVLQPYQMVKDLRTGVESGQPDKVLDGDLDGFLNAALAARVHGTSTQVEDID